MTVRSGNGATCRSSARAYADYARANASIGLNAVAINNVNADHRILDPEYLRKVAALADLFRPYGIRLYLSANFAAPRRLGGLASADPLDKDVAAWWKAKADEIYKLIPDFGGFLVKANSEGQPGPKDYNRNHAEGASVLADAVAPHGGNVIWRAFIYDEDVDPDRTKRAYIEFTMLDGQFRPNVLVQIKNSPLDFQPRRPFHALFGAPQANADPRRNPAHAGIPQPGQTPGLSRHDVEGIPQFRHIRQAQLNRRQSPRRRVHPQALHRHGRCPHPGLDTNWCGHHFCQANWYAGPPRLGPRACRRQNRRRVDRMTFTNDAPDREDNQRHDDVLARNLCEIHHAAWATPSHRRRPLCTDAAKRQASRRDWTAAYYHQAAPDGIGFNRAQRR